jgi:hypothetical protein
MTPLIRIGLLLLCAVAGGCNVIGVAAQAMPPPTVEAQYTGLTGKRVAVLVWADRGIRIDWPSLQLDLAGAVQRKLSASTAKKGAIEGATFPYSPASVARYQEDHPESEFEPIEVTAAKIGVDRLIYVEVEQFATRSDTSDELFRGKATASIKAIEVGPDGKGRIVYEESDVVVFFPTTGPKEGTIRGSDYAMYAGTIDTLAKRVADRFVPYQEEDR